MNTISQLPTLKNIAGTVYVPAIKENSNGDFTNYKVDSNTLLYHSLSTINALIKAYLDLNSYQAIDTTKYYSKTEVDNLIKKSLKDYLDEDTVNTLISELEDSLLGSSDVSNLVNNKLSSYATLAALNSKISELQTSFNTTITNLRTTIENTYAKKSDSSSSESSSDSGSSSSNSSSDSDSSSSDSSDNDSSSSSSNSGSSSSSTTSVISATYLND